jgi:indole-3-glycerol phosphate synthase
MTTDLGHTFRMLDLFEDRRVVVSESGIRTGEDLARLRRNEVNIALVGEHLMLQADPGEALHRMLDDFEEIERSSGEDDSKEDSSG